MDIHDISFRSQEPENRQLLTQTADFLLFFLQGVLLPFTTAARVIARLADWALGPDAETTRCIAYTTFERSWAHFRNDDFLSGRLPPDDLLGVIASGGGILEIRDLGHALSVTTRPCADENAGSEYIWGFAQGIFFVCVDLFVWRVFAIEVLAKGSGREPPWYGEGSSAPGCFWVFLGGLVATWGIFSVVQVMLCGRQMFFWRMVLLAAGCWITRLWWGAMDGKAAL